MTDLVKRIEKLEQQCAIVEIMSLEAEYCRRFDFGTGDEWAELFTPDAVFEAAGTRTVAPVPGVDDFTMTGRETLAAYQAKLKKNWAILHQVHLPSIVIEGDTAHGTVFFESPVTAGEEGRALFTREIGVYEVKYQRTPDGWKIAHRVEHAIFRDSASHFGRPNFRFENTPA